MLKLSKDNFSFNYFSNTIQSLKATNKVIVSETLANFLPPYPVTV